jgi:cytochrome c-type biogenesis protein CcmE
LQRGFYDGISVRRGANVVHFDRLALELLVILKKSPQHQHAMRRHLLRFVVSIEFRIVGGDSNHFMIFLALINHCHQSDHPRMDDGEGNYGFLAKHQNVQRVVIFRQSLRDETVVGWIVNGGVQDPVEFDQAARLVEFVLYAGARGDLNDRVEFFGKSVAGSNVVPGMDHIGYKQVLEMRCRRETQETQVYQLRDSGRLTRPESRNNVCSKRGVIMSSETSKFLKFGGATVVILLALGYLAYTGVQESKSYYVTIKELHGLGDSAYTKRLRVAGNVQPGSIKRTGTKVEFMLVENDQVLPVVYSGTEAPPDTFKDNSQALADGSFGRDGVFHAKQLQAKCASKYAPQPGANTPSTAPAMSTSKL